MYLSMERPVNFMTKPQLGNLHDGQAIKKAVFEKCELPCMCFFQTVALQCQPHCTVCIFLRLGLFKPHYRLLEVFLRLPLPR